MLAASTVTKEVLLAACVVSSPFAVRAIDWGCVGRIAYPFFELKGWRVIYLGLKRTPNCGDTLGQKRTPAVDP